MPIRGYGGLVDGLFPHGDRFPAPVTPGRKSRVRFDVDDPVLIELPFGLIRKPDELARGAYSKVSGCRLVQGVGWQLAPIQTSISSLHERTEGQGQIIKSEADGGKAKVAPGMLGAYAFRKPTELTGATTGADPGVAEQADWGYQKQVPATKQWDDADFRLSNDQSAYPPPPGSTNFPVDRVLADGKPHEDDEAIIGRLRVPGKRGSVPDVIQRVYFSGPASFDRFFEGKGNYVLTFRGSGILEIEEKGKLRATNADHWTRIATLRWCEPNRVAGSEHWYEIRPHRYAEPRAGVVGVIYLEVGEAGYASMLTSTGGHYARGASTLSVPIHVRSQRKLGETHPATDPQPIRRDERRDLRTRWQLSRVTYPAEGYIFDAPFTVQTLTGHGSPGQGLLYVWYQGKVPAGTSIIVELFEDGKNPDIDAAIAHEEEWDGNGLGWRSYVVDPAKRSYQVKIKLASSGDRTQTPTLYEVRAVKDGIITVLSPGEFVADECILRRFSAIAADADPSHESGTIELEDPQLQLSTLLARSSMPVVVDTEYDFVDWSNPVNDGLQSVIARGYVTRATAQQKGATQGAPPTPGVGGGAIRTFAPGPDWRLWSIDTSGAWQRLSEAIAPFGWDFMNDLSVDVEQVVPYKVTDAIRTVLGWAGFPWYMIDIPDLPIRFFPKAGGDSVRVTTGAGLGELAVRWARDYLGMALIFDANAGEGSDPTAWYGMWRLKSPPVAPYRNLAYFTGLGPSLTTPSPGKRLVHMLRAYETRPGLAGQVIAGAPYWRKSFKSWVRPPEANQITVVGGADISSVARQAPGADVPPHLAVTVYNFKSADFYPGVTTADPNHPDYLGRVVPLLYVDPNLPSAEAVQWVARRLYNVSAKAIKMVSFTAPLVLVTDTSDTKQKRPRPLRYLDPVLIEDAQFIIRSANPFWTKDGIQLAHYECEAPREPGFE